MLRHPCALALILLAASSPVSKTSAQTAYWSLVGDFPFAGEEMNFDFDLSRSVGSGELVRIQTHSSSGGTNAAGNVIPGGSFDPILQLGNGLGGNFGSNNDGGTGLDSFLSWPGLADSGGALNSDPLLSGSYVANLIDAQDGQGPITVGPFALDLFGPPDAMTFTGVRPEGDQTLDSLIFGTTIGGVTPASYTQAGRSLPLLGDLIVAQTGYGSMTVSAGGQVSNTNGTIGNLVNSNGTVTVTGADNQGNASTWTNRGLLTVGENGAGVLNILAGGEVSAATASSPLIFPLAPSDR